MPTRNSIVTAEQVIIPRRSLRLLHQTNIPEPEDRTTYTPKSRHNQVRSPDLSYSNKGSKSCGDLVTGSRKSPRLNNRVEKESSDGLKYCINVNSGARKSPRLNNLVEKKLNDGSKFCVNLSSGSRKSSRLNTADEDKTCKLNGEKELRTSNDGWKICENLSTGSRKTPRLNGIEEKMIKLNDGLKDFPNLNPSLRRSSRLTNQVEGCRDLRQLSRVSNWKNGSEHVEKTTDSWPKRAIKCVLDKDVDKEVFSDIGNGKVDDDSCEQFEEKRKRKTRMSSIGYVSVEVEGGDIEVKDVGTRSEEIGVSRKRKQHEEDHGNSQGWTKEQEFALQRAYFSAKPTPHFWKKVSKLVPGKTAQDCFDKVHSNDITPPQQRLRSRANRTNKSSLDFISLSASKLLKPTKIKGERPSFNKPKSRFAQKTVRDLLLKHYQVDQDYEMDLFSVLEPNMNESTQASQSSVIFSTPTNLQKKQGFLHKCFERSSSGHKKSLSRFSSLSATALVSPPVLKQVKNRALHEKYIDQLHYREAKRKAASERAEKLISRKENKSESHQEIDVIQAAKNALVSDARDAINQLQHLHANVTSNSSDLDDDDDDNDEEGEDEI